MIENVILKKKKKHNYVSLTYDKVLWSHPAPRLGLSEVCFAIQGPSGAVA